MKMINVVVVDDHPIVREGLKRIIAEHEGMAVTGEAADGREALRVIQAGPCDVVLLDLAIPEKSGLDVLMQFRSEKPALPVLILSASPEDHVAVHCMRAGAAGYMSKETALTEVVRAIQKVLRGGKFISEKLADKLVFNVKSHGEPLHEGLSGREHQVLCLMASGKTVSQIGEELALSVKTISTYRARIMDKLMIDTNAALIRYALKECLVT